ncbi:MAG TPA: hypothetical protein VFZ30_00635 [Acidimicrobiales bacterium]
MHDQLAVAVEADEQVLAPTADALDGGRADVERRGELGVGERPRQAEPAAD